MKSVQKRGRWVNDLLVLRRSEVGVKWLVAGPCCGRVLGVGYTFDPKTFLTGAGAP